MCVLLGEVMGVLSSPASTSHALGLTSSLAGLSPNCSSMVHLTVLTVAILSRSCLKVRRASAKEPGYVDARH